MKRRGKIVVAAAIAGLVGMLALFIIIPWLLWKESVAAETAYSGGLAETLGQRTEDIFVDTRDLLAEFNRLDAPRCSPQHIHTMQQAAISRPYIRAIGYWQATERACGVGFLPSEGLKPPKADRIYENGVIAWWPSRQTQVGDVQLFLMRFGDHDVAIDPRLLLDLGHMRDRQAGLWVENLRMSAIPRGVDLPDPSSLAVGVTMDREGGRVISRFSRSGVLPIDVVAVEPIDNFWSRHRETLSVGVGLGLFLMAAWITLILRVSRHQLSLATDLRQALNAGRIRVHYQPVISLVDGRCIGAEALARWERSSGEWVEPDVFIPVAEAAGMVQDVTLAVLAAAVREMKDLITEFPGTSINLNLAAQDLENDRIGVELARILANAHLPTDAIKLEITERALLNTDISRALIRQFRSAGHQVAVDDFGTGYSSLSYLQSFELDVLKIDKSFVDAIGTEAATSQVIVHVIEMAKSLGLDTVAEGVETPEQMEWLQLHGVAYGQGYLFSRPLRAGDFLEYFRNNRRTRPPPR